jgi:hypothetical protein
MSYSLFIHQYTYPSRELCELCMNSLDKIIIAHHWEYFFFVLSCLLYIHIMCMIDYISNDGIKRKRTSEIYDQRKENVVY